MYSLEGTIDRFENDQAIIKLESGATLLWPKEKMPANFIEGKVIKISLLTDNIQTEKNEEIAKNILNEILQNE